MVAFVSQRACGHLDDSGNVIKVKKMPWKILGKTYEMMPMIFATPTNTLCRNVVKLRLMQIEAGLYWRNVSRRLLESRS